jgi:hypothetical protein
MTTAPSFNEIIRRQRAHRLAQGKCETKAELQYDRRAAADELAAARRQIEETEARAGRYAALAWVCGLVVGILLGVIAS